jgi:hypothetical protein
VGYLDELATESFQASMQADKTRLRRLAEERLLLRLGADTLPDAVQQWLDDELAAYERQNAIPAWTALASVCDAALSHEGKPAVPLGAPLGTADGSLLAYAFGISPINPVDYPRPAWLATAEEGATRRVLPVPGVELAANRRDEFLAALARDYSPDRAALAACHIDIDPLNALSAASEALGTGGDIRPLALQVMSQGWNALAAERDSNTGERPTPAGLALSLRGAPVAFKPDPDMLLLAPVQGKLPACLPVLRRAEGQPTAWVPVTEEAVAELRLPAAMLRPSARISALASTVTYATQYPVPGLAVEELDLAGFPPASALATSALTKGHLVGVPYLAAGAVKGWKGELTPADAAALVARSVANGKPPAAPKLDQWTEHTAGTGGALLFRDQFEALVTATSGFAPAEAYNLRVSLLRAKESESIAQMKVRFAAGCAENGLDTEGIEALWQALAASAPDLQSRCSIAARARAAMWAAFFKAEHPAAFIAAHLAGSLDRGGIPVRALLGEASRLKVGIKPPDASHSMPAPTLERGGSEWTILWGLTLLPGWTKDAAQRFVAARPRGGFARLADFALAAVDAGLSTEQLESLVLAGGCDTLGGQARSREAFVEALPAFLEWARAERGRDVAAEGASPADLFSFNDAQPVPVPDEKPTLDSPTLTPRERYLRRAWEVARIGAGFTPAGEIEALKRTLAGSHLHSRLLRSVQVGEEHVGKSINLVGLLTRIRLVSPPASNGNGNTKPATGPMSVGWVEDAEGAIELVAFPPGYKRHAELWTENSLVIVTGRVRKHDSGEVYLLCEHMAAFDLGLEEAEISVKVKQSKKAQAALDEMAATAAPPAGNGTHGANGTNGKGAGNGAYPASVPAPTPAPTPRPALVPPAPTTTPAITPVTAAASTAATASTAPTMTNTAMTTTDGQPAHKIIITLPITEDDQADIDRMIALKEILQEHPGTDVVTLRIPYSPEPGHLTTAQLPRGVAYSTVLEAEVVRLLGTEAIGVIRL